MYHEVGELCPLIVLRNFEMMWNCLILRTDLGKRDMWVIFK